MNIFEQRNSKIRRVSVFVLNFSVLIIIVSMLLLVINQNKINKELEIQNKELNNKNKEINTLLSEQIIKNKLIDIISAYTDAINKGDLDKSLSFYADTVSRFFLRRDVDIEFIEKEMLHSFRVFKGVTILFNTNSVAYNIQDNQMIATINKEYFTKDGEKKRIITEMRFNKEFKIIYIRDYYPNE